MPEPFRNFLNAAVVHQAATHLQRAWPAFDRACFERLAIDGLDALALKARAMHIADALEATLPPAFTDAAAVIGASLGTPLPLEGEAPGGNDVGRGDGGDSGIKSWFCWPLGEFVARRGR